MLTSKNKTSPQLQEAFKLYFLNQAHMTDLLALSVALFASERNLTSLTASICVFFPPLFYQCHYLFSLVIRTKELEEATTSSSLCSPPQKKKPIALAAQALA